MFTVLFLLLTPLWAAQNQNPPVEQKSGPADKGIGYLFNYLNMAGTARASQFRPVTQRERNQRYLKTMTNPIGLREGGVLGRN
jgi:hypothetical protein